MNISTFITWFINSFITIGTQALAYLDQIKIVANVSLLKFIVTITIIGAFINILLTIPNNVNRNVKREAKKEIK